MTTLKSSGPAYAPTHLIIDLDAIANNYKILDVSSVQTPCAAVVKSDAYGLGMEMVSSVLATNGCRTFFVSLLDEGLTLRRILPEAEIFILNGLIESEAEVYHEYRLTPVLNDISQIEIWSGSQISDTPQPAALHFDTGMARLGLTPVETQFLIENQLKLLRFPITSIISHLACADDPSHPLNKKQLEQFELIAKNFPFVRASLAASSGIFLGPKWHFDFVRPGASLYGVAPTANTPNPMCQVVKLQGRILQLRDVDTPQSVGYGATHEFTRQSRVATVAVGYADGYLRSLSGQGTAYIGNVRVPVIGRVSMDLITLDVTGVSWAKPGDMVDLIGPRNDVDTLAADAGTIGYEILTSLGNRYRRIYTGKGI